ncbi:hypothetical protein EET67_09755 [Pseudaminobacter arsenicus]|uniref:Uncharacterized protein n=1 Tax=Borborobacter arsenicus TaxID=1851146 RepID=A0A432V6U2_9HYPH|nr:hypothetical protein [Pseudaminobacter arsenicus]RUM97894.1 hypothetical protein EET67_09755 [Pseudaminobacter arsenicus]
MNARFSDYVTSGAFSLTLTRNQISELALAAGGERRIYGASASLERKGLIEPVASRTEDNPLHEQDDQQIEYRLTGAGGLTLALLAQAGLSNSGTDVLAREVDDLRQQLSDANQRAHDAALRTRSMFARLEKAKEKIAQLQAQLAGDKLPILITPADPLPEVPTENLLHPERTDP